MKHCNSTTKYINRYSLKAMSLISLYFMLTSGLSGQMNRARVFTIHEYVHTQQKSEGKILLGQALAEGACDFITELVLETELQHAYLVYGREHEEQLREQFRKDMFSEDFSDWLYNDTTSENVGDLGYFMGYAICKAYYHNATDKDQAIAEIIELDYADTETVNAFLTRSKYY